MKNTKEDLEFFESIKDLPPEEKAVRSSLKYGTGICYASKLPTKKKPDKNGSYFRKVTAKDLVRLFTEPVTELIGFKCIITSNKKKNEVFNLSEKTSGV